MDKDNSRTIDFKEFEAFMNNISNLLGENIANPD